MRWYTELLVDSLEESLIFGIGCAVVAVAGMLLLQVPFTDGLGFALLIVSAGLILVGGAMSFVSPGNVKVMNTLFRAKLNPTPDDYRKNRHRAALFALTGVLLFSYSLALAAVLP